MCYPFPGPRCSHHAYQEYVEALKRYETSMDAEEKLILGSRLKEKLAAFDSTLKGQNTLRRDINAATGLEKEQLLVRLQTAEITRKQQLDAYAEAVARKDTSLQDAASVQGVKLGRYQTAMGVAMLQLETLAPGKDFHIATVDTLEYENGKFLVVPEKYQKIWGTVVHEDGHFKHVDQDLQYVLNNNLTYTELVGLSEQKAWKWFQNVLMSQSYRGIVAVNRKTNDIVAVQLNKLPELYDISLKLKKKLGGTTKYTGSIEKLADLAKGTVFAEGKIVQNDRIGKTILYGVPPQPREFCFLSDEIYLGWHPGIEEQNGYYEVRRRHQSQKYDVSVVLKTKKQLTVTAVDDALKAEFK